MAEQANNHVYDASSDRWVPMTQPSGGGSGGGGDASAANQQTEIARLVDINTSVGTVKTATDAVATAVDAGNTALADVNARLGAVDEVPPNSDTAPGAINGRLKRLTQRISAMVAALPVSLGAKNAAGSLSVTPATDAAFAVGAPRFSTAVIVSLQTAAVGTTFTAFAAQACTSLNIVNTNPNAVDLEVRRGGAGNTIIVPAGASYLFGGIANASDLQVRRQDVANTQITFTGEALA